MLIGELARATGLTRDTIRFYESQGLIHSTPRPAGTRVYNDYAPQMVARVNDIKQAQSAGFTLREIKAVLDQWGDNVADIPDAEMVRLLSAKLGQAERRLRDLQATCDYLRDKLRRFEGD